LKIGILETGHPPEALVPTHGSYGNAFEALLKDQGFTFQAWAVVDDQFPASVNDADGWLITGSKFGAYEDLPWIPKLETFIREVYNDNIPIVGICFGHQILAQALGGTVEKYADGWSVGRVEYDMDGHDNKVPLYAWHQDQIIDLPPDVRVTGSTEFCRYAALVYGDNKAFSLQPHPEFTQTFFNGLLNERKTGLPKNKADEAKASIGEGSTNSAAMANAIADFFKTASV